MKREDLHPEVLAVLVRISQHLAKQRATSMDYTYCRYTSKEGHHCAVGCILPAEAYSQELEGLPVDMLISASLRDRPSTGASSAAIKAAGKAILDLMPNAPPKQVSNALHLAQRYHDGCYSDTLEIHKALDDSALAEVILTAIFEGPHTDAV